MMVNLKEDIALYRDQLIGLRRDLHAHPELSYQEERTARLVADRLTALGLEVRAGVARTGVVGLLRGGRPGKTLLVRADTDALPLVEQNEVEYRSQTEGVMHACGHDGHTAVAVILASILAKYRETLSGAVKFVFQPAEERIDGAKAMIEEGVMHAPEVDAVLALHLWNHLPVGQVGVRAGPTFAAADEIEVVVRGRSGHGAMPHQAVDAILVASHVVTALQSLVSREVSPLQPAVVTIGTIHGGTAFNIIADEVKMTGTIRTFDPTLRDRLLERIEGVVRGTTAAMRAEGGFVYRFGCPPVVNEAGMTELVRRAATAAVGADNVTTIEQSMGSDDIAFFLQEAPGCYFLVGSANPAKGLDKLHHTPNFDFDEEALPLAVEVLARAVLDYLGGAGPSLRRAGPTV